MMGDVGGREEGEGEGLSMPVLVEQQLQTQKLNLLSEKNLTEALSQFVEKEETDAISELVFCCTVFSSSDVYTQDVCLVNDQIKNRAYICTLRDKTFLLLRCACEIPILSAVCQTHKVTNAFVLCCVCVCGVCVCVCCVVCVCCSFVKYSLHQAQTYLKGRPGINEADIDTQVPQYLALSFMCCAIYITYCKRAIRASAYALINTTVMCKTVCV